MMTDGFATPRTMRRRAHDAELARHAVDDDVEEAPPQEPEGERGSAQQAERHKGEERVESHRTETYGGRRTCPIVAEGRPEAFAWIDRA